MRTGCSGGAANPLVHQLPPYRGSSCAAVALAQANLQALRDLDKQHSFLRGSACGDVRLLVGSPELAGLFQEPGAQPAQQPTQDTLLRPFSCRVQYFPTVK
jgi:hypothetical protein